MEKTGTAPAGESEDAETNPTEEALRAAQGQEGPGRSEPESPPDDPDDGEWVPA